MKNEREYFRMARAEGSHWWYRSLYNLVLRAIKEKTSDNNARILDAGCGTGGLISFLSSNGFRNLSGFDASETAVHIAASKAPQVCRFDIRDVAKIFPAEAFDFIVCNDVLYYLTPEERASLLCDFHLLLRAGGRVIMNLPALNAFHGKHDLAVGITTRFSKHDLDNIFQRSSYAIIRRMYWPFFLAPAVFLVRGTQRLSLELSKMPLIKSDVSVPYAPLNTLLFWITRLENDFLPWKPFGSSLFIVADKVS